MADVARFPPLPAIPPPPAGTPDDRQQTFRGIVGGLAEVLSGQDGIATVSNVAHGYRAAAVDLGALQEMLGAAIARFDMQQVRARWDVDLFIWMRRAIFAWVQRCKQLQLVVADNGIHVVLQTQDDHGYYRYELDVFPGIGG